MMRPKALMEAMSANLNRFLQPISADLARPQQKFLRDGLVGLLRAGRPVVCRMARKLPDRGTASLSRPAWTASMGILMGRRPSPTFAVGRHLGAFAEYFASESRGFRVIRGSKAV